MVYYLDSSSCVSRWIISEFRQTSHGVWDILSRVTMNFLDIFSGVSWSVTSIFCREFHGKLCRCFFPVSQGKWFRCFIVCLAVSWVCICRAPHDEFNCIVLLYVSTCDKKTVSELIIPRHVGSNIFRHSTNKGTQTRKSADSKSVFW